MQPQPVGTGTGILPDLGCRFLSARNRAGRSAPWQKEMLKEWEPSMPIEVRVEGTLRRGL